MLVHEILKKVCILCGKFDIAKYIAGQSSENYPLMLEEEKILLQAFHTIECELAMEYLPIIVEERIDSNGFIALDMLKESPLAIQSITDSKNRKIPYTLTCEAIQTVVGRVTIRYSIYPKEKALTDSIQIPIQYSRVLVLGVATEYAMLSGQFELFGLLEKKYRDSISYACRSKGGIIKMRRWI